jgi:ribonuclease Z
VKFALTILGSSSALPTSKRFPTAHLLNVNERFFLIDCGEGTQMQLRKLRAGFGKINHIFISHLHGDHVFGIFGILSSFQLLGRKNCLNIYAPEGFRNILEFYKENFAQDQSYEIVHHRLGERGKNLIFEDKIVEVYSFPLKHRQTTLGFLFREKPHDFNFRKEAMAYYKPGIEQIKEIKQGADLVLADGTVIPNAVLTLPPWKTRSYAFCSDTAYDPRIVKHISGVDLLYHEATFSVADENLAAQTMHSSSRQAAQIAKNAGAGKLLIGHFSSRYRDLQVLLNEAREIFPDTEIVEDGNVYEIPKTR